MKCKDCASSKGWTDWHPEYGCHGGFDRKDGCRLLKGKIVNMNDDCMLDKLIQERDNENNKRKE